MHSYLRAIGFSEIKKTELNGVLKQAIQDNDSKIVVDENDQKLFVEISKEFGLNSGLTVCGEYDENNEFQLEYYFPYFNGTGITTREDVIIERRLEKECFSGACDDVRIGVTLIFYLSNAGEYLQEKYKGMFNSGQDVTLTLSGLSTEGKILLPIEKKVAQKEEIKKSTKTRAELINQARNGSEEAMESLTMDDMDTYSMISKRIVNEDVLSIVDTYFMPYGMECDKYHVLGEITDLMEATNHLTGEKLYQMTIDCNNLHFDVCMNQKDLLGKPEIGRRFKGVIWLQGRLNFAP